MPAKEILRIGNKLFSDKGTVNSLWQHIAENFYPERADFTTTRKDGEEFADGLFTSVPPLARRELGNMMSAALRPRSTRWWGTHVMNEGLDKEKDERAFLEFLTEIQWRATYESRANFVRATKQADHDFAAFGNAVIQMSMNSDGNGLFYRNFHLRDCAWSENAEGRVDSLHRKWTPTARQLDFFFPEAISQEIRKAVTKDPDKKFDVRHAVVPSRMYRGEGKKFPYRSLFIEVGEEKVLEDVGLNHFPYIVPRWQTVSGSQYGSSMATSVLLPDGRTMQAVMRTLREAGEKYVDPPMIAVGDAIRGDYALYAGGITQADIEYDERLGEVLRPITQDRGGIPIGIEIAEALKADITAGFFLDKLQLPEARIEMTAFEIRKRLEEHIRANAPIYEPIEEDYSEPMTELGFNLLREAGAFPLDQMPQSLQNEEIRFSFRSPLADMAEQREAEIYLDGMTRFLIPASQIDPAQMANINLTKATREALIANGWKAEWLADEKAVEQKQAEMAKEQEQAKGLETISQMGEIAGNFGKT